MRLVAAPEGSIVHANSPLEASVLVLNKLFMAVHVISVRAFCLLCKAGGGGEPGRRQFATYNFESWRN